MSKTLLGSPPRMRGKGVVDVLVSEPLGITPACAGKSPAIMVCSLEYWGSPPRMRGKVQPVQLVHDALGITPACAGKRAAASTKSSIAGDHPRVCGEKACGRASPRGAKGSPPRVRGKVSCPCGQAAVVGITPAYAGKSCPPQAPTFTRQDHPRVCGEKCPPGKFFFITVGSPPRMRGKVPSSI